MIGFDLDASRVEAMLDRLATRAIQAGVAAAAAERAARGARISGIPVRTGRLQASTRPPQVRTVSTGALIVTDVPYARFVFGGTFWMAAPPPTVEVPRFGDYVLRELFA